MLDMLSKMNELRSKMDETKKKLERIEVCGESAGGNVRVYAAGDRQIRRIEISDDFYQQLTKNEILELILQAVNKASSSADEVAKEEMKQAASGLLPNIPGMGF